MGFYKDRTREFFSTAEVLSLNSNSNTNLKVIEEPLLMTRQRGSPKPLLKSSKNSFLYCAYQLYTDIQNAGKCQTILEKLANNTSLQNENRPAEFADLLNKCKGEIKRIERSHESLQQQHSEVSGSTSGFLFSSNVPSELEKHREAVLSWLKKRINEEYTKLQASLFEKQKVKSNSLIMR